MHHIVCCCVVMAAWHISVCSRSLTSTARRASFACLLPPDCAELVLATQFNTKLPVNLLVLWLYLLLPPAAPKC